MTILQPWFKEPNLPTLNILTFANSKALSDISETSRERLAQLSLDALVKKLKVNSKLTNLEWLVLLNKDKELSELSESEQTIIGNLVWKHIFKKIDLFQKSIKKLMRDYEFGYHDFPNAFKQTLLRQVSKPEGDISKLQLSWVRQLILGNGGKCAGLALKHGLTPRLLCLKMGLNSDAKYVKSLTLKASDVLAKSPAVLEQQWWVNCQDEVKASETVGMLEQLLLKLSVVESDGPLDKWLTQFYLPDSPHTEFYKLNEQARQQLLSLYNVTTYDEVKNIFKLLRDTSVDPSLNDWEVRNLKSRIDFWSDYSDSFKRVRFILTTRAYDLLKKRIHIDTSRIAVMADNTRNNSSEICIFEFDNFYIIERFRNEFDMGVFAKTTILESKLFSSPNFDGMSIIPLIPDGTYDHKYCYQYFVPQELRACYGIKANIGSKVATGKRPSKDSERDRKEQLLRRYANGTNYFNI